MPIHHHHDSTNSGSDTPTTIRHDFFAHPHMELEESPSILDYLKGWVRKLKDWMKPDPTDNIISKGLKFILKCIALLLLLLFSPVILAILVFVFFAAF